MREVKFRAKPIDGDKWVYGSLIMNGKLQPAIIPSDEYPSIPLMMSKGIIVRKETVGEFTGIKDKNGIEIYEGTIVTKEDVQFNAKSKKVQGKVKQLEGMWVIDDGFDLHSLWSETDELEIIGNTYENA